MTNSPLPRREPTHGETIKALKPGAFITLAQRLANGGSLQARKLSSGTVGLYWRYTYNGKTSRDPDAQPQAKLANFDG